MSLLTRAHDLTGTLLLDLNGGGGYERKSYSPPRFEWRRNPITSPVVDGSFGRQRTRGPGTAGLTLQVRGASWLEIEQRVAALEAALDDDWLFVVGHEGVDRTYRAQPPNIDASYSMSDFKNLHRLVVLDFECQPNPSIVGLV